MTKLITIDWLSLYVQCPRIEYDSIFTIKRLPHGTRQYKCIDEYWLNNERIATLCHQPHSTILLAGSGILKYENQIFYKYGYERYIPYLLNEQSFNVLSISRVDIACDFQYFENKLAPQALISKFLHNKIWKIGAAKYRVIGHQAKQHHHDYLRFGSNTSDVSVYLYNKSLEMRQVKQKNYIIERWKELDFEKDKDIWRLEVSIKGSEIKFCDKNDGEVRRLIFSDLLNETNRKDLYFSMIEKYFEFRINDNQQRKNRMKRLILFSENAERYIIQIPDKHNITSKSDKIFVRKCEEMFAELRERNIANDNDLIYLMANMLNITNLQEWYNDKIINGMCTGNISLETMLKAKKKQSGCTTPVQ